MFLKKRKVNEIYYWSLAENYREDGKVKQRIIKSLGTTEKAIKILKENKEYLKFLPAIVEAPQDLEINKVLNMNCLDGSKKIKDKSIDMIFTDLPFGETHNSWDKIISFNALWSVINRVKKDNAAVCLFAKGKFLGQLMCSNIKSYRYKVVCKKRQPKGYQNSKKMPMKAHEDVLIFYDKLPLFNPQKTFGHKRKRATVKKENAGTNYNANVRDYHYDSTERYPLDVLEFSWDTYTVHPTQKPLDLCEWFIKTYTNEGMTILDLTAGYGSIPLAAIKLNRNFVAFDNGKCDDKKKTKYYGRYWADLANERISKELKCGQQLKII